MSIQELVAQRQRLWAPSPHESQVLTEAPVILSEPLLKRPLDILLAIMGLIVAAPLWIVAAIAIKLESPGPVLYRQTRWGRGGRCFEVLKFRTMQADSDEIYGIVQAASNDSRVTRVGRILRATGIDELPQIVNILRGEMSLVGPRALALGEYIQDSSGHKTAYEDSPMFFRRLAVRPGLTSLATVYLPKDASAEDKFVVDLTYLSERSLILDLRLILVSIWVSLRGRWEVLTSKL